MIQGSEHGSPDPLDTSPLPELRARAGVNELVND